MKIRTFLVILLGLLLIMPGTVLAARGDREELNFGYVDVKSVDYDTALVARPAYIYGVTIKPKTTAGRVDIYDNSSTQYGTVKVELGEAAQYDTRRVQFDPPIRMENGIYVDVTSASVVVEYR